MKSRQYIFAPTIRISQPTNNQPIPQHKYYNKDSMEYITYASLLGSGMLASTDLMSDGPKPVKVRLCLGRLNPGPTGFVMSEMGAPTEGRRSRAAIVLSTTK